MVNESNSVMTASPPDPGVDEASAEELPVGLPDPLAALQLDDSVAVRAPAATDVLRGEQAVPVPAMHVGQRGGHALPVQLATERKGLLGEQSRRGPAEQA